MFRTWKDLAAKCAVKTIGDHHFTRDYRQARHESNRQTWGHNFLGMSVYAARYVGDDLAMNATCRASTQRCSAARAMINN